ncbi:MAG: hypothetical protein R2799_05515 [Crocinitomicaceae bacterium]
MSISELYESGVHKHNKGHYRNLLLLARADGSIDAKEEAILDEIGKKIGLSNEQISDIKKNPEKYPTYPPFGKEERIVRYINFIEVIKADGILADAEINLLKKFGIALGFSSADVEKYFNEINRLLDEKHTEDEILAQLY